MSKLINEIYLECTDCPHRGLASKERLEGALSGPPTYSNIAEVWSKFKCKRCQKKSVRVLADNVLLLDPKNTRYCQSCGSGILLPRIQSVPLTGVCAPCAEDGDFEGKPDTYPTPPPDLKKCRRCKRPAIVRENSQDGSFFVGCTNYPHCMWTAELPEDRW